MEVFINNQEFLIDRWCSRKQLKPLRHLLNGQASLNGLTDGWAGMLTELNTIRAQCTDELQPDEFETVVQLIHKVQEALER